jgi:hypothetical protein
LLNCVSVKSMPNSATRSCCGAGGAKGGDQGEWGLPNLLCAGEFHLTLSRRVVPIPAPSAHPRQTTHQSTAELNTRIAERLRTQQPNTKTDVNATFHLGTCVGAAVRTASARYCPESGSETTASPRGDTDALGTRVERGVLPRTEPDPAAWTFPPRGLL